MKKLLLSIVIVSMLLVGAFLIPTTASAHSTTATRHSVARCTYTLTPVSKTTTSIVVHINDCLAQSLGTIGILPLAALITNAGVEPGLAFSMAGAMIGNQQLILGVDLSCSGRGVNVGYDPLIGIRIGAACP
jgi:hypothetical protein